MSQKFFIKDTGMCGIDEFVEMRCVETGNIAPYQVSENKEWRLEARIGINFWANQAQFSDAREIALIALRAKMYEEIMCAIPQLRLAISDGSKERSFRICDEIESFVKHGEAP